VRDEGFTTAGRKSQKHQLHIVNQAFAGFTTTLEFKRSVLRFDHSTGSNTNEIEDAVSIKDVTHINPEMVLKKSNGHWHCLVPGQL